MWDVEASDCVCKGEGTWWDDVDASGDADEVVGAEASWADDC